MEKETRRRYTRQFKEEAAGKRLEPSKREELMRLRREIKTLRQKHEILKKAAAPVFQGEERDRNIDELLELGTVTPTWAA